MRNAGRIVSLVVLAAILVAASGLVVWRSASGDEPAGSVIAARIRVPGQPFRVAAGEGFVWVLTRGPTGCAGRCAIVRIDPGTNRVVGEPLRLRSDAWNVAVGYGAVWVTNFDGRLTRIDARTGRMRGRLSARPLYFGSVAIVGGGFIWTGNDDERNRSGSISKIDPATNSVVATVSGLRSPQSIAFGRGAVWVADHAGSLVKIDATTGEVEARQRLPFGAHGVVVASRAVYVADAHAARLVEADLESAEITRTARLPIGPINPAVGAGSLWSGSAQAWTDPSESDDRVVRIDPETLAVVETFHAGGPVPGVAFGFGSAWAAARNGRVLRITPS